MACPSCTPELAPTGPRRHDEHHAVRFKDWPLIVLKNGVPIPDCFEVDVLAGQAWRCRLPLQLCACGKNHDAYIDTGRFSVEPAEGTHHEE